MVEPPRGHASREALEAGTRRRLMVVVNPHAASVDQRAARLVAGALRNRYEVLVRETDSPHHAVALGVDAIEAQVDGVVTLGGDGTVNEAANGLAGSDVALFPLPGGSQNVLAKMLGIPSDVVDAIEHLLRLADDWRPRRIDLARANGRVFTFSAGAGLDAAVVQHVDAHPERKARWRELYYMASATQVFARRFAWNAPRFEVETPDGPLEAITLLVQNGDPYTFAGARPVPIARDVALDSGSLSAAAMTRASLLDLPTMLTRMLVPRLEATDHRHAQSITRVTELRLRASSGQPIGLQVDGDFAGEHEEIRFELQPAALTIVA